MKLKLLIVALFCSVLGWGQVTIFSENMYNGTGGASGNSIAVHETNNRFNEDALTYSGTGDMRETNVSSGYGTASGTWNVMMNATGETFVIDGINASAYTSLVLSFGVGKAANAPNGSTLIVEYSTTGSGGTFTAITWPVLPTGTGTSYATTYYYRSSTSVIPSNVTTIRFRTTTTDEFRVDDILLEGILASSNTITTDTALSGSPFCVSASTGASVSVPFTSVGTFNAGNVYTAQLSNAAGSFASPVSIGTVTSVLNSDVISATIPAGTAAGTGYRIRVVSSNPVVFGSDNGTNLTIRNAISISAQPANQVITDGNNATFSVTATGTTPTYQWQVDTGGGFVNLTNGAPYSNVTTATMTITAAPITMNGYLYRCIVSGAAPCGSVTSNSGSLTVTLTAPNNPTTIVPCYRNTSVDLSWTAPSTGTTPDGYMVFALAGGTSPAATTVVAGNASLYTANSNFSLATVVTASLGKCVYKGTGTSVLVTGLTNSSNYSFKVVAYRGGTATGWSAGINVDGSWNTPTTNIIADMPEVSSLAASVASGQSALTWNRPTPLACYDEYLVVANQGSVVFTPSGDGTAYIPNTVYSGSNQVVYNGTGAGVTVTGLTNGLSYCYKVFVRRGTEWSNGVEVCQIPNIVYCVSGATSNLDSEIENVTLVGYSTTISNNTANVCTTGVNNYTAMSANLQVGGTYTVAVEFGDCNGATQYDGAGGVWIDWNNDGDFLDANETIGTALVAVSGGNVIQNFTINVPGGQPIGNYRMRIVQTEGGTLATINPCGTFTYGSTEDYTVQVINACIPTHSVTSFTPTSGPVGTEVTINGTGLTGSTVTFSGVNATIVSNTGTQMVVVIPAGAITGMFSVKDSQPCAIDNAYTIIKSDNASCEGAAATTDLIIYDIHDEQTGSGGFITLYNGTAAAVNLTNYSIWRTSNHDDGNEVDYANLTGTIAPGALGILKVSVGSCGPASTNGTIDNGFNEDDGIQLRNAAGTVIIDDVDTYPTGPGYYMVRNTGALSARTSYVAADWSTIPLAAGVCYPSAGLVLPTGGAVPPMVTSQPSYTPSCGSTTAILTTAGTEGFAGGNTLTYQWFFAAPGSATWTAVANGGIYSGATTASLTISSIVGVIDYQYYCQIRENTATCYTASNAVKITDTNATTWNGLAWSNGVPTLSKAAIIDGTYVTATNGNFSCCSLTVNATRTLTISSDSFVEVQNDITNNGILTVLNTGSLVQINDLGINTGNISYERIASVKLQDYVYWSSPVSGFDVNSISPLTPAYYHWEWNPTIVNPNGGEGNWVNASTTMLGGKGYIVRAPNGFSNTVNQNWTATFNNGVPNNGVYTPSIARGTDLNAGTAGPNGVMRTVTDDNWNLLGNPYPSAISIFSFLGANTQLEGFVRIWTHGNLPSTSYADPFYNNFVSNYTANDYIALNGLGATSGPMADGLIGAGQGFFVLMQPGGATTSTALFNNAMRSKNYSNSHFYRNASAANSGIGENIERHRIWLDLVSPTNETTRTLVGYVEGATAGKDRMFDAFTDYKLAQNFYSLIDNQVMAIQGKGLPFEQEDKVPLGIKTPSNGIYKIAIGAVDGLFSGNQNIYLEDKLLGIIYDLRQNPYSFTATSGILNDRFVLRYTNETLGNEDFENDSNILISSSDVITVQATNQSIQSVQIHNVLGQLLINEKEINVETFEINTLQKNKAPLLIQVTLENGKKVSKKLIY